MAANKPVLVLDLDGTLVDTRPDLVAALNHVIAEAGIAAISQSDVGETVGQGARAMIVKAYALHNVPLEQSSLEPLGKAFVDYYLQNIAVQSTFYPGAQRALQHFRQQGWILAICTNKQAHVATRLLEQLDVDHWFAAICGSDTFSTHKPHPDHLLNTIRQADGNVAGSVMVGDTASDIDAAINANIASVAVDFGYSVKAASSLGADRVISHFDQLWPTVAGLHRSALPEE